MLKIMLPGEEGAVSGGTRGHVMKKNEGDPPSNRLLIVSLVSNKIFRVYYVGRTLGKWLVHSARMVHP